MARKATRARSAAASRRPMIGDRYRLEGTYERLRRALLEAPDDGRLDKALSYWVLPTDRRLPIAFLDRSLRDLLALPLEELMETQGVGQKKILGFFDLLRRAHKAQSPHEPFGLPGAVKAPRRRIDAAHEAPRTEGAEHHDPSAVSEAIWAQWCDTILRAGLGRVALGRVAPSLRALPTVIWRKTLGDYATLPLAEIRRLKTHGEKRVNTIVEVFGVVHEAVSTSVLHEALELELTPRFVPETTRWLIAANPEPDQVDAAQIREHLAAPLARQIETDLGDQVAGLVRERLGLEGDTPTVTQQADRLGVTRARVYQLLEECAIVLDVRWPEGRWLIAPLGSQPTRVDPEVLGLIHSILALFYPD